MYDYQAILANQQQGGGGPAGAARTSGAGGGIGPSTEICTRSKLTCLSYNAATKQHLIAG